MKTLLATVTLTALFTLPAQAATSSPSDMTAPVSPDARILTLLDIANISDIEQGKLAMQKAEHPRVREFGERMVAEHKAMQEEGEKAAAQLRMPKVPPAADADIAMMAKEHVQTMEALRQHSGGAFDRAYIKHEIEGHQQVLDRLEAAMREARSPAVKQLIEQSRPVIKEHLVSARAIDQTLQ